jgi:anti-anti-sigma factor
MNYHTTKENDLVIFHLDESRLDATNSAEVKAEFLILCQKDLSVFIVDLTHVEFADSSGLSALLLAERTMRGFGGGVLVVDKVGRVRTLIEISKLTDILPVFGSVEEAKAATEE